MRQTVGYVTLLVRDYDEAIAYYTRTLGFRLVEDTKITESKRWVLMAPPGARETCLLLAKAAGPAQQDRIGDQTGGRVFLFLHTDDFARDHRNLLNRGVAFVEAPRTEPYGTVAVFTDLYGNRWDLLQPTMPPRILGAPIEYRQLTSADLASASQLACAVFNEFVAPAYTSEGVQVFLTYAAPDAWRVRHEAGNPAWAAFDGAHLVGVIHVRDRTHLSLLFVDRDYQRRGIARHLIETVQAEVPDEALTVHSSPNAVVTYARLGFEPTGPEQQQSGIRFMPMRRAQPSANRGAAAKA